MRMIGHLRIYSSEARNSDVIVHKTTREGSEEGEGGREREGGERKGGKRGREGD